MSSNVEDGTVDVPLIDSLIFTFNKPLPFNSLFTSKFHWEPRRDAFRSYIFLDADRQNPLFEIHHQPDTDYSVFVYGVQAQDGDFMDRPFTLNYTTAENHGPHRVSGQAEFGVRQPPVASKVAAAIKQFAAAVVLNPDAEEAPARKGGAIQSFEGQVEAARTLAATLKSGAEQQVLSRTVVFLLDAFSIDRYNWRVKAASALDEGGTFTFDFVREGTYYPVAINFADEGGEFVGAYGYYDPEGDYEPNPITVGGDLTNVDVTLFDYRKLTAFSEEELAAAKAASFASDAHLVSVSSFVVEADGTASDWMYEYYAPSIDNRIAVYLDPLRVLGDTLSPANSATMTPVSPADVLDSQGALDIAFESGGSEFMESHSTDDVRLALQGGNVRHASVPDTTRLLWQVDYTATPSGDRLTIILDMKTGEVLTGPFVAIDDFEAVETRVALDPIYPNPSRGLVRVPFRIGQASNVTLTAYDLLGRRVATLVDRNIPPGAHETTWDTSTISTGVYVLRLDAGGAIATRTVTVLSGH